MAFFIGFSGPAGSGKTTLMNAVYTKLRESGVKVHLDDFKVSRAVQEKLGWESLDRVLDSYDTMCEFQTLVYQQKMERIREITSTTPFTDIVLSERTFADIVAYYKLWAGKFGKPNSSPGWERSARCIDDGIVYVPTLKGVDFEFDPKRGFKNDLIEYDELLKRELAVYSDDSHNALYSVKSEALDDRVNEVINFINSLKPAQV